MTGIYCIGPYKRLDPGTQNKVALPLRSEQRPFKSLEVPISLEALFNPLCTIWSGFPCRLLYWNKAPSFWLTNSTRRWRQECYISLYDKCSRYSQYLKTNFKWLCNQHLRYHVKINQRTCQCRARNHAWMCCAHAIAVAQCLNVGEVKSFDGLGWQCLD